MGPLAVLTCGTLVLAILRPGLIASLVISRCRRPSAFTSSPPTPPSSSGCRRSGVRRPSGLPAWAWSSARKVSPWPQGPLLRRSPLRRSSLSAEVPARSWPSSWRSDGGRCPRLAGGTRRSGGLISPRLGAWRRGAAMRQPLLTQAARRQLPSRFPASVNCRMPLAKFKRASHIQVRMHLQISEARTALTAVSCGSGETHV
jgi:hypothetical protein